MSTKKSRGVMGFEPDNGSLAKRHPPTPGTVRIRSAIWTYG